MLFFDCGQLRLSKQAFAAVALTAQNLYRLVAIVSHKRSFRVGLLTLIGGAMTWTATGTVARYSADAVFNPNSIIDGRSPGAREASALTQTKPPYRRVPARTSHGTPIPHQRVLAEVRRHAPDIPNEAPFVLAAPFAPAVPPVALNAISAPTLGLPDIGSPFAVLPAGSLGTTPVAPVPEVDTWVMLIAGMGMLGGVARRRRGALSVCNPLQIAHLV